MAAANKVIAGDYNGFMVLKSGSSLQLQKGGLSKPDVYINKGSVETYEVITDEHRKSIVSGAIRGSIGAALLGPAGLLAGGLSAKNKGTYTIAVKFKNGKSSLLELNEKNYKSLMKSLF